MSSKLLKRRFRAFKRKVRGTSGFAFGITLLLITGVVSYAYYMSNERLTVNPQTYKPLLSVIAKAESNGNYNAYFGNSGNSDIDFTDMAIADVMQWQKDYVAEGSPSSAVGRYQFISGTLAGLVEQLGLNPKQKFDEPTQDRLAIALLERRGSVSYVNQELSREEFAASLAKEWAGLPKIVGDNPGDSYYAGDGLNAARIEPDTVLKAIEPISP